jgi:rod shape-determining protein MreD
VEKIEKKFYINIIRILPIVFLYLLVLTGFDLSFFYYDINFSFNFVYLIIFFFVLKNPNTLSYGLIFLAGIINDVVQNYPIGISSINYLLLCAIAAFVRSRMILPNLFYDWILFFIAILIVSSVNYTVLTMVFEIPIKYGVLMFSSILTALIYPILSKIFNEKVLLILRSEND